MARFQKTDAFKAFKISGLVRAFNAFNAFNAFKTFKAFKGSRLSRLSKFEAFNAAGLSTLAAFLLLVLTGCGHNIVTYGDGIGFETTFRPDNGNFGIVLRYGKVLTATVRENVTVEMQGEGQGGGEAEGNPSASSSASLNITTGPQITGYFVDAVKAGKTTEELKKYIEKANGK